MDHFFKKYFITLSFPPLFYYLVAYIFGILAFNSYIFFALSILVSFISFLIILLKSELKSKYLKSFLICLLFLSLGLMRSSITEFAYNYYSSKLISNKPQTYSGIIYDIQKIRSQRFNYALIVKLVCSKYNNLKKINNTNLENKNLEDFEENFCQNNFVKLLALSNIKNITPGKIIEFSTKLVTPKTDIFKLRRENILATGIITNETTKIIELKISIWQKLINFFNNLKYNLSKRISAKMPRTTNDLFNSIFLGTQYKSPNLNKIYRNWNAWGIAHYLARSGLHIVVLLVLWTYVIMLMPISFNKKQIVILSIIIFYYLLSWSTTSFNRAILAALAYIYCKLRQRPIHQVHLLSLICLLILLYNPEELFFLDFQLSFGLTFLLIWYNQLIYKQKI